MSTIAVCGGNALSPGTSTGYDSRCPGLDFEILSITMDCIGSAAVNQRSLILHPLATATLVLLPGPDSATVERGSAVLKALDALCHPKPEGRDVIEHLGTEGRDGVFNPGRNLSKDLPRYEPVALQSAEGLRKGLLADAFDPIHNAGEAHGLAMFGNHAHGPERPLV
jgi:hypothetical protein